MRYTLGLKKLPFEQNSRQIIYVESDYDVEVNNLIKLNYKEIRDSYRSAGYEFCYIPWLASEIEAGESYNYFVPYYKSLRDRVVLKSDFILDYMVHPENRKNISPSLLFYHPDCISQDYPEAESQFIGITIDKSSFEKSPDLKNVLLAIWDDIENHRHPTIRFQKVPNIMFDVRDDEPFVAKESEPEEDEEHVLFRSDEESFGADDFFDTESRDLMAEIQERIDKLKLKGISTYIIKQMIKDDDEQLSRILIKKDYSIILPDYKNIEIKMTPLPKAVFFLFLNHPEGIIFKYLPDYQDELFAIYKKVKGTFFNTSTAQKSIEDVTNPLSNSINEKCARIREAFVSQFDDRLAKNYYIEGARGEAKKITLPRTLVEWE